MAASSKIHRSAQAPSGTFSATAGAPASASSHWSCRTWIAATGGGLPKSAITELTSPQAERRQRALDSRICCKAHMTQRHFLASDRWARFLRSATARQSRLCAICFGFAVAKRIEAVKAADLLLRDGNFPLVVLDLVLNASEELRKIPQTTWYRLQRLVEAVPTAFLVLTRQSMISSAQLKLSLENVWRLADLESAGHRRAAEHSSATRGMAPEK